MEFVGPLCPFGTFPPKGGTYKEGFIGGLDALSEKEGVFLAKHGEAIPSPPA